MYVYCVDMAVALTSPKRVITYLLTVLTITPRCNERRVLHSSATSGVWIVLKEASAKLYPVKTIGTFWCSLSSRLGCLGYGSLNNAFGVHSHSTNFRPHVLPGLVTRFFSCQVTHSPSCNFIGLPQIPPAETKTCLI